MPKFSSNRQSLNRKSCIQSTNKDNSATFQHPLATSRVNNPEEDNLGMDSLDSKKDIRMLGQKSFSSSHFMSVQDNARVDSKSRMFGAKKNSQGINLVKYVTSCKDNRNSCKKSSMTKSFICKSQ